MRPYQLLIPILALSGIVTAQTYVIMPASTNVAVAELPDYNLRPFMQTNSRVQMFFSATEAGQSSFTATALSLRYDGPIPQVGASGPFTIQRLQLSIGSSTVGLPSATFASNIPQALTPVFDAPFSYLPDPGTSSPQGFGDPNDTLTIHFTTPALVTIPTNGWLVIDLQMTGNNIASFGFSHAILDGVRTSGGTTNGTSTSFGTGCGTTSTAPAALISTSGSYAPGAAHFLAGQNLGANALVIGLVGLSNTMSNLGPLPLLLPGTSCQLLASPDLLMFLQSNSSGAIAANQQSAAIAVPASTAFSGLQLFEQLIAFAPAANAFDMISSDARAVVLGTIAAPLLGIYTVSNGALADATIADKVDPFGYAVRLQLQ
ncbi:MAG: hypothetical protein NT107_04310 [Planctomycetota bacterium]|nr:hypothetical protein [Planctomycetota bacterium]